MKIIYSHLKKMILEDIIKPFALLFFLFIGGFAPSIVKAQDTEFLQQEIPEIKVKSGNISLSLNSLASKYNIPIGEEPLFFQKPPTPGADSKEFTLKQRPLRDVLNFIVSVNPEYRWKISNQVINFTPTSAGDSYSFLNVEFPGFKEDNLTVQEIKLKIAQSTPVKNLLKTQGLEIKEMTFLPQGENLDQKFSLDLKNATVRDIFNEIVKNTNRKRWTISRWGDRQQYVWIMFS